MEGHIKELIFDLVSNEWPQTDLSFRRLIMLPLESGREQGWQGDGQKLIVSVQARGGEGVNHGSSRGVKKKGRMFKTQKQNKKESVRDEHPVSSLGSLRKGIQGRLGGAVGWASDFGSGHDLTLREFEPHIGLRADSSEPGTCFGFCVSLSL